MKYHLTYVPPPHDEDSKGRRNRRARLRYLIKQHVDNDGVEGEEKIAAEMLKYNLK